MADGFVSQAQKDKWTQLLGEGKVTQAQFDARDQASPKNLPVRGTPRKHTVGASRSFDAAQPDKVRY